MNQHINTKDRILELTNRGLDVFNFYLRDIDVSTKKLFKSPFYDDTKASCGVFMTRWGNWHFKDLGDGGRMGGDCFWFVAQLKGLDVRKDFVEVMSIIIDDLNLSVPLTMPLEPNKELSNHRSKTQEVKATIANEPHAPVKYTFVQKPFSSQEIEYWSRYGISEQILEKHNVKALKSYSSERASDGKPFTLYSSEAEPMYLYEIGSAVKLYRPNSDIRFLQGGLKTEETVFGLDLLPMRGDIVFITGGEKDVMSLSARGFHAICFNSETSGISESMIDMLNRRFKHIAICYDMDATGKKASAKLADRFKDNGVFRIELPLSGTKQEKDVSDYFAIGHNREDFSALIMTTLESKLYNQTMMLLKSCEIDTTNPPVSSESVISVQDTIIGAYDNLLCITGGEGTGKSNFVSSLISGAISQNQLDPETTIGIRVECNPADKAVLHYDTEQSDAQLYKNVQRSLRRAGLNDKPSNYHAICLTSFSRKERLQLIQDTMDMFYHKHGGIHLVVIDGIADLIRSANDEIESVAIVEELYRLAGIYNTCILCVLHFVPNSVKLRGHIGSELQRKSAGILSIEKDTNNPALSLVKALKVRDGDPLDIPIINVVWDKVTNMQVYRGTRSMQEKEERKYSELLSMATRIFKGKRVFPLRDFMDDLHEEVGAKDTRTSKRRFDYMIEHKIIACDEAGEIVTLCNAAE